MKIALTNILRIAVAGGVFLAMQVMAQPAFKAPPAPDCAAVKPEGRKAECGLVAKANGECSAAKSMPDFNKCMSDTLARLAPGFKLPPPPNCEKAPAERKAQCEMTAKGRNACSKTRSAPEYNLCMGTYMRKNAPAKG